MKEWITNEENQQLRFEMRRQGLSNIAAGNPSGRSLQNQLDEMADITGRMDTNREIVDELKKQMEVFADF